MRDKGACLFSALVDCQNTEYMRRNSPFSHWIEYSITSLLTQIIKRNFSFILEPFSHTYLLCKIENSIKLSLTL